MVAASLVLQDISLGNSCLETRVISGVVAAHPGLLKVVAHTLFVCMSCSLDPTSRILLPLESVVYMLHSTALALKSTAIINGPLIDILQVR